MIYEEGELVETTKAKEESMGYVYWHMTEDFHPYFSLKVIASFFFSCLDIVQENSEIFIDLGLRALLHHIYIYICARAALFHSTTAGKIYIIDFIF